jgi:hypothetical protein
MITTTYKCDKCGKEQDTANQMWNLALTCQPQDYLTDWAVPKLKALWCRECTERAGLNPVRATKGEEPPNPAKLEEIIRDIVRQEVAAVQAP